MTRICSRHQPKTWLNKAVLRAEGLILAMLRESLIARLDVGNIQISNKLNKLVTIIRKILV